jgi:hypothetical protein
MHITVNHTHKTTPPQQHIPPISLSIGYLFSSTHFVTPTLGLKALPTPAQNGEGIFASASAICV